MSGECSGCGGERRVWDMVGWGGGAWRPRSPPPHLCACRPCNLSYAVPLLIQGLLHLSGAESFLPEANREFTHSTLPKPLSTCNLYGIVSAVSSSIDCILACLHFSDKHNNCKLLNVHYINFFNKKKEVCIYGLLVFSLHVIFVYVVSYYM